MNSRCTDNAMTTMTRSCDLFYRLVGFAYLAAFVSYYVQWPGLWGYNGLLPASTHVERLLKAESSRDDPRLWIMRYLHSRLGFPVEAVCELSMWAGMVCSARIVCGSGSYRRVTAVVYFVVVWLCYMHLIDCGQTFLSFQWDILLQECGFLCILATLFDEESVSAWTFRMLAFKLMFLSGVVKLQAQCPTWYVPSMAYDSHRTSASQLLAS